MFQRLYTMLAVTVLGIILVPSLVFAQTADVVGIRVVKNPNRLSPATWYFQNVPNPGSPQSLSVNGYPAVRDGRSTYIAATNLTSYTDSAGVDQQALFANIYIISFNENSAEQTQAIFNQLMKSIFFNTNISEPVQLTQLRNDMKRAADVGNMQLMLDQYRNKTGKYPTLEAGTFIKGLSFSVWPSWQSTLGNALGTALPVDPINKFSNCADEYDKTTCWSESKSEMQCPTDARVYAYKVDPGGNSGTVYGNYEFNSLGFNKPGNVTWQQSVADALFSSCTSYKVGLSALDSDGDGISNAVDKCPYYADPDKLAKDQDDFDTDGIGDLCDTCPADPFNDIDRDGRCGDVDNCPNTYNPSQSNLDAATEVIKVGDACDLQTCNNGKKEGDEQCDTNDGLAAHQKCSNTCTIIPLTWCGDGFKQQKNDENNPPYNPANNQTGEECDPKASNPPTGLSENDQYICTAQCKWAGGWCNDKIKNGTEVCDNLSGTPQNGTCAADCKSFTCDTGYAPYQGSCLIDTDNDNTADIVDNCPSIANVQSENDDNDAYGNACDYCPQDAGNDTDGDKYCVGAVGATAPPEYYPNDNCPTVTNANQRNQDNDNLGDACDLQTCGDRKIQNNADCTDTTCGTKYIASGEVCDGPGQGRNVNDQYQCSDGLNGSPQACTVAFGGYCGNGSIEANESCDKNKDTGVISYAAGEKPYYECDASCSVVGNSGYCGDGQIQAQYGEQCDGTQGAFDPVSQICNSSCKIADKTAYCGNNVIDPGEQCDDGRDKNGLVPALADGVDTARYCTQSCQNVTVKRIYEVAEEHLGVVGSWGARYSGLPYGNYCTTMFNGANHTAGTCLALGAETVDPITGTNECLGGDPLWRDCVGRYICIRGGAGCPGDGSGVCWWRGSADGCNEHTVQYWKPTNRTVPGQ